MKRDQIETLKNNANLDVRLPDQLKDEFLRRCQEEGVPASAVIRSLMIDYIKARPRHWSVMAAGLKENVVKRSKWIAGGIGGVLATGLTAMSVMLAPMAAAEDIEVRFDLTVAEGQSTSDFSGTYKAEWGESFMVFHETDIATSDIGLTIEVRQCQPTDHFADIGCDVVFDIEVFEAVEWRDNELGGVDITDKRVLAEPVLLVELGNQAAFQVRSDVNDDSPIDLISGNLLPQIIPVASE